MFIRISTAVLACTAGVSRVRFGHVACHDLICLAVSGSMLVSRSVVFQQQACRG
jgi:hypothetical protein